MLQRIEPSDSRLALTDPSGLAARATDLAAGSVLHLPHGDVAADFRSTGTDDRTRSATYELVVSNDTPTPLATFAYAVEAPGSRSQMTWNAIVVPPFSAIAVEIDVAIPRRRRMPRVVAEVFSDAAQLTLDAPPPRPARGNARRFALVASAVFLLALGAGAYANARPRVVALAAPDAARAGTPFSVAYAMADASGGHYVVESADGMQVRRGDLARGNGAFTVSLPKSATSSGYDVRVWADGRFSSGERTAHVVAMPTRVERAVVRREAAPRGVRLGALALERETVHGGESIVVTYRETENPGVVRLIDSLGTVRSEALLTRRGRSIVVAPQVDADQDFRIVATVERGTSHDESTAPVTILHAPAPAPSGVATQTIAADARTTSVAAPRGVAPIAVDRTQAPGRDIVVRIDHYQKNLHVALIGASTDEIVGANVGPGEPTVVLTPPIALASTKYAIVATYSAGLGQETLIRPIVFRAP